MWYELDRLQSNNAMQSNLAIVTDDYLILCRLLSSILVSGLRPSAAD
jgi:hypothetical protein